MIAVSAAMWRTIVRDAFELRRAAQYERGLRGALEIAVRSDGYRLLMMHRFRQAALRLRIPLANTVLRNLQQIYGGIEIGKDVTLGHGVYFVHPVGVVVGGDARIGNRVRFYGCNTVGTARDDGYPTIEDDVWLGAGARVLGPIRIGAGARIGANAVVLQDVPAGFTAVGVPATLHAPRNV